MVKWSQARWPMRRSLSLVMNRYKCLLACLLFFHLNAHAVVESGLWLPTSYQSHYLTLIRAAKLVEDNAEGCVSVIRGELNSRASSKTHPIFRLTCRNEKKRSFAVVIDGVAMEVIDPAYPGGTVSFPELKRLRALEEQRLIKEAELEAERQELLRQETLWLACSEKLAERTKSMKERRNLIQGAPPVDLSRESYIKYTVDFDAKGGSGQILRYRAVCEFDANEKLRLQIRPRKTAMEDQAD